MKVVTLKLNRIEAFALIHLDKFIFVTVVKVKNDHVCLTVINTKKIEGTILRHLSNRKK